MSNVSSRRPARTQAEWDELALNVIVPALQAGATMTEMRAKYGAGPTIRRALDRVGYNTKGLKVEPTAIKASGKALAARVAARRADLAAWWRLEHETGKSMDELKALLAAHGYDEVTGGRVTRSQGTALKATLKPARNPRARKAKKEEVTVEA